MLLVIYNHALHGRQEIICNDLEKKEDRLCAKNIHGVTFQTLEGNRIESVQICPENKLEERKCK